MPALTLSNSTTFSVSASGRANVSRWHGPLEWHVLTDGANLVLSILSEKNAASVLLTGPATNFALVEAGAISTPGYSDIRWAKIASDDDTILVAMFQNGASACLLA